MYTVLFRPFSTIIWDQIPFFLGYCEYIESAVFNLIWKRFLTSNFLFLFQQVFKKIFFAILINMGFNLLLPTLIIHIYIITYTYLFPKSELILRKLRKYQIRKMSCKQKWVFAQTRNPRVLYNYAVNLLEVIWEWETWTVIRWTVHKLKQISVIWAWFFREVRGSGTK